MKKFTRSILGAVLFHFVFSLAVLYFFIVSNFAQLLMILLVSTAIFAPTNITLQKFLSGNRFSRPVRSYRQLDKQ